MTDSVAAAETSDSLDPALHSWADRHKDTLAAFQVKCVVRVLNMPAHMESCCDHTKHFYLPLPSRPMPSTIQLYLDNLV